MADFLWEAGSQGAGLIQQNSEQGQTIQFHKISEVNWMGRGRWEGAELHGSRLGQLSTGR